MVAATEVFTPNSSPIFTYVDRAELDLESRLKDAFSMKNMGVSISGPSKSGKTVLLKKVVDSDVLININGASIKSPDDLWRIVLRWMDVPATQSTSKESGWSAGGSAKTEGKAGIPYLLEATAGGEVQGGVSGGKGATKEYENSGLEAVVKEIGGSEFIVFIDDFHYIDREQQEELGRHIKAAIENGVKMCTASVPHRADDVVRSNPELRGRLSAVDLGYWGPEHLEMIAYKGFPHLNCDLAPSVVRRLAEEAFGSPQLMQSLCLNLCFQMKIRETLPEHVRVDVTEEDLRSIFLQTSTFTDWSSLVEKIHSGPRQRGTERKTFRLSDGSSGDVYRAVLLSMVENPPQLALRYDEILARIRKICLDEPPVGSSVNAALQQMSELSKDNNAAAPAIEWDEDVLDFVEPYFLFYLRASDRLGQLGR